MPPSTVLQFSNLVADCNCHYYWVRCRSETLDNVKMWWRHLCITYSFFSVFHLQDCFHDTLVEGSDRWSDDRWSVRFLLPNSNTHSVWIYSVSVWTWKLFSDQFHVLIKWWIPVNLPWNASFTAQLVWCYRVSSLRWMTWVQTRLGPLDLIE